ncbi:hypothetical protein [Clostridium estertheticum]|uniref:hypothetical protein n=1 Tax=Clostridium estertheticum TaxID=238834 RepID=UPI003850B251
MNSIFNKIYIKEEQQINFIDVKHKEIQNMEFLVNNKLIFNSEKGNLLDELKNA